MRDVLIVQVLDCLGHLLYDNCGLLFLEDAVLLELCVERALVHVFQHDVEVGGVVEEAVHSENVLVIEAALQPDLKCQLFHHHVRLDHGLRNLL